MNVKQFILFLVVMIPISLLCMNGCEGPRNGHISQKGVNPAHYETVNEGDTMIMAGEVPIFIPGGTHKEWRDTTYWFYLKDGKKEGWIQVTKETYDGFKEGDWVDFKR